MISSCDVSNSSFEQAGFSTLMSLCLLFKIIFFHFCLLLFHTPAPNAADLSNHKSVKTQTSLGPERGRVNQVSDE